ncbi:MAG TPA: protein translocase subunit SecD [Candidatus Paceibacterota bacterium]|nr:protein translocase subunit SecD [Candidatus Paceibacterota bacterium]
MTNSRIIAVILLIASFALGFFTYKSETAKTGFLSNHPFKLGLDLNGGTHLVYQADVSKARTDDLDGAMDSLRDTIETRVNAFGIAEPLVQVEKANIEGQVVRKLIVELPGVTDTQKAIDLIGATPLLEFKLFKDVASTTAPTTITADSFADTGLTGQYLDRAAIAFNPNTGEPLVDLTFNDEGKKLFAEITKNNVGKILAIFLDGQILSDPVIREEIREGKAQVSGNFTPEEAKTLVRNLNFGALPLPISLVGTQTIGASLGEGAVDASMRAGIWSFIVISLFLILWYRLPGLIASIALAVYTVLNLVLFKLMNVTLTSAGIAGFILSIGMAVDANILIFERMKEELKKGLDLEAAIKEGFARAWLSIRDSNLSSIITAFILFYFATSSLIKGFALVFLIGVLTSMFTAITFSRTLLYAIGIKKTNKTIQLLFGNGITKN